MRLNRLAELSKVNFGMKDIVADYVEFSENETSDYRLIGRKSNLLHLILSGTRYYLIDGQEYTYEAGTVLFIPDGTQYLTVSHENCSGIGIKFALSEDVSITRGIYADWFDKENAYRHLFESLVDSVADDPKAVLHHTSLLYRILDRMCSDFSRHGRYSDVLQPAVVLLKDRFRENLPVGVYAATCNLSESHFRRIFTAEYGMSPLQYRNALRYEEARRLKREGYPMSEIANLCGFCDSGYLRKLFRRDTGESLKHYTQDEIV